MGICGFQTSFESRPGDTKKKKRVNSVKPEILVFFPSLLSIIHFEESSGSYSVVFVQDSLRLWPPDEKSQLRKDTDARED